MAHKRCSSPSDRLANDLFLADVKTGRVILDEQQALAGAAMVDHDVVLPAAAASGEPGTIDRYVADLDSGVPDASAAAAAACASTQWDFPVEIAAIRALDGPRPRWQFDFGFRVGF